jgi:ABC-type antimicrobial peptide transport system permease subunit
MPMEEQFADLLISDRFGAVLMAALAAAGLLLATLGLYGVMAYSVNQRVGEIGLRMALGAQRRDVRRLIVRKGLRLSCLGLGLGLVGGWVLARLIASRLYGVSASAPWTFVAAPLVLTAVALLACWLPAQRATRIDPMEALR